MRMHPLRKYILGSAVFLILIHFLAYGRSVAADTCVDCHTSVEILKKLAPPVLESAKPLSEGEG